MNNYFEYLKLNNSEHMTWGLLRKQIAAGRVRRGVVFCKEGSFCGRCAFPLTLTESSCRGCRGLIHIEIAK